MEEEEEELGGDSDRELLLNDGMTRISEPQPLSLRQLLQLNVGWAGMFAISLAWNIVTVPSQVRSTAGDENAGKALSVMIAISAILVVFVTPYLGMLSDSLAPRWGRRRPYMVLGAVVLSVFQIGMGLENPHKPPPNNEDRCSHSEQELHGSMPALAVLYIIASQGYQLIGIPYSGLIADKTPPSQRGISSGLQGLMIIVGYVLGSAVGIMYQAVSVPVVYVLLSVFLCSTIAIVCFTVKEDQAERKPLRWSFVRIVKDYVAPLRRHDFRWVFLTRLFMQMGLATTTYFLELFYYDVIALPGEMRAEQAVSYSLLPMLLLAAVSSVVAGKLSDRLGGRRKVFVAGSAFIMTCTSLGFVFARSFAACIVITSIFGVGYGIFLAVDFAMVLDVLPDETTRAKDLAVWHLSLVLPQFLATPIGGLLRDYTAKTLCHAPEGQDVCAIRCATPYVILYSVTAGYFLLCALCVACIRSVR